MKFEIGEIAIIAHSVDHPSFIGSECEIVGLGGTTLFDDYDYEIEIKGLRTRSGRPWCVGENKLKKKKPPQELVKWEDCIWKPNGVAV